MFVVVQTEFDRSNTSLKSFIFVCSQEVRPETILFKFIKTNFVSLCSLWLKLCSIGRTRVLRVSFLCAVRTAGDCIFISL